ncbi:hypothetical protein BDZ90DRAFT_228908 [Jaminaea rosea]|uniref:Uncharacterized protein n=1 Tax=Jaminaea rosea TaxID=1569628 RepID=A0A316UGQ0_9BASI|nr:hypothetical protein BDZ90DRAFT_228908 [Jaminaea rosea]PWN24497.1 hypothetical protein BDZ90DRAFT_228908 [Jaminaea rosea]
MKLLNLSFRCAGSLVINVLLTVFTANLCSPAQAAVAIKKDLCFDHTSPFARNTIPFVSRNNGVGKNFASYIHLRKSMESVVSRGVGKMARRGMAKRTEVLAEVMDEVNDPAHHAVGLEVAL